MRKMSSEEAKKLELNILEALARYCDAEGLRYFLDYGTLLGAVRHGGFIPWDDDVDVTMPREDYEVLYRSFSENPELLGPNIRLASYRNQWSVQKAQMNLLDIRTRTISRNRREAFYYPVFIDILPADNLPANEQTQRALREQVRALTKAVENTVCADYGRLKYFRMVRSRLALPLLKPRLEKTDRLCRSAEHSDMLGCFMAYSSYIDLEDRFPRTWFDDTIDISFEGRSFRAPRDYDRRLRDVYGDYMQLPPEEKRIPHFDDVYWINEEEREHA